MKEILHLIVLHLLEELETPKTSKIMAITQFIILIKQPYLQLKTEEVHYFKLIG